MIILNYAVINYILRHNPQRGFWADADNLLTNNHLRINWNSVNEVQHELLKDINLIVIVDLKNNSHK